MEKVYIKSPDFVQRDVAGECILVPIRRKLSDPPCIYVLNETGAALWRRIDGTRTVQDIVTDFCEEYEAAADQVMKDFAILVDDLLSINALQERSVVTDA
ncbi:MAG: hypothetical protein KatS3mg082_0256 [Nitrospiraceae bacterium]|jgi:hypothetical protein|nr:MAG: hypothetical protein KatS3mg082_0256 [Nitrospiraceae bacterium]